jgi:hypothetical protein
LTRTRRQATALVAVAALGLIAAYLVVRHDHARPRARPATAERPASAQAFVDSVGVNIHSTYNDTAYANREQVVRSLRDLGVRNVRDGLVPDRPDQREYLLELARNGIRTTFIMGAPNADVVSGLDRGTRAFLDRTAAAFEGPNEYDVSGDPQWASNLRGYQQRLYRAVKDDPDLTARPVLAPSLVKPDSPAQLGALDGMADMANVHPYPGGRPPEESLAAQYSDIEREAGGRPVVATEAGYHNALASQGDHPPTSERAASIYLPRLLLEDFRRGIRRTFLYELVDLKPDPGGGYQDAHFGLLRNDFGPKPAYGAVRTLLRVLSGPPGSPDDAPPLRFALSRPASEVHHLLLARGDGTYYLALWQPATVWDTVRRRDILPTALSVRVRFAAAPRTVEIFRPSVSPRPVARAPGRREIEVKLEDDVVLLRLAARAGS